MVGVIRENPRLDAAEVRRTKGPTRKASRGRGNQGDWAVASPKGRAATPEQAEHNAAIEAKRNEKLARRKK